MRSGFVSASQDLKKLVDNLEYLEFDRLSEGLCSIFSERDFGASAPGIT